MLNHSIPVSGIAPLATLMPTQITAGMLEVEFKRERWRGKPRARAAQEAASVGGLSTCRGHVGMAEQ